MKVLHVTPVAPGMMSGGEQGIRQSLLMLCGCKNMIDQLDYAGPPIAEEHLKKKYDNLYELKADSSAAATIVTLLHRQTNKRFIAWKNSTINYSEYDILYLDSTKLDYVPSVMKKWNPNVRVITRVHNVERDYAWIDFRRNKSLKRLIIALLAKRQEYGNAKNSDILLMLSKNDICRFKKLYRSRRLGAVYKMIPVCVEERADFKYRKCEDEVHILLTGALWFGPNADGILWFIDRVVPLLDRRCRIRIAGADPGSVIKKKCRRFAIELIDTPDDMAPFIREADVIAIPIFEGAGMKVKFAEALSYGKVVISTSFGAAGYDVINGASCMIADDAAGFAESIHKYRMMNAKERVKMAETGYQLFKEKYSIKSGTKRLRKILYDIQGQV